MNPIRVQQKLDTTKLYRMPWTMADNSSTWLEITRDCDISCEYCVQDHNGTTHKSLKTIKDEIRMLLKLRKCDSMIIAGGEPLTHPQVIEVVKLIKDQKVKPLIITNAVSLDIDLIKRFKKAGLFGFILHIDSGQHRPGWENKTEKELNKLRQYYADLIHKEKSMVCSFITTIIPRALSQVKHIVEWCAQNIDKVVQNIFIPVRGLYADNEWEYFVNGKRLDIKKSAYTQKNRYKHITALDIYKELLKALPEYKFNSYLGGTQLSQAPKWLLGLYVRSKDKYYGNLGAKGMEMIQSMYHLFKGKYLSLLKPGMYKKGWLLFFLLFDRSIRKTFLRYLLSVLKNPLRFFKRLYFQSLIVMQPFDVLENGDIDMCDGCPNKTYWNGRLVSECRMEEYINYGKLMQFKKNMVSQAVKEYVS